MNKEIRKIKMGMIGGGIGSFIGDVHRKAAMLDGLVELVCGAFSSSAERSRETGEKLFLPQNRCYDSLESMIKAEKTLPQGERMDFLAITTPNHLHFSAAKLALQNGFHVVCDKPMTLTVDEAQELASLVEETGMLFALTHSYTGYPMVHQAKVMIKNGDLGNIRRVQVHYLQGWMATSVENEESAKGFWRQDPSKSGMGGALADIGTHSENLLEYITGLKIVELAADLGHFGKGRKLDDDGNVLIRMENAAKGTISFSQIATGEENNLSIRVYGEKGSLEWHQENPNQLITRWLNEPLKIFTPNGYGLYPEVSKISRIPSGHPEGYIEAFATVYRGFANHLISINSGEQIVEPQYPTVKDGLRGLQFIRAAFDSNSENSAWKKII